MTKIRQMTGDSKERGGQKYSMRGRNVRHNEKIARLHGGGVRLMELNGRDTTNFTYRGE